MPSIADIALWSSFCALAVGGPLNGLLLWLIARHTTTVELRPYARLLTQTIITDLLSLVVSFLVVAVNLFFERLKIWAIKIRI
jgi:hypothetical protein